MAVIARYDEEWEALSPQHEELEHRVNNIVSAYAAGEDIDTHAIALVGVFGSGKTQLMYHIHRKCVDSGVLPLYFEANRLLDEIFEMERNPSSGDVTEKINLKVTQARDAVRNNDRETANEILNPAGHEQRDKMIDNLFEKFGGETVDRLCVLVDELEQQYDSLQDKVMADENSPLRDWLERSNELKFVALAPSGMYEMGGADQTRVERMVIPHVDIGYVRDIVSGPRGMANSAWWLSRGNSRHVMKNITRLERLDDIESLPPEQVAEEIRNLDEIGKEPTKVPAADTEEIPRDKIHHLLNLVPVDLKEKRRYVIHNERVDRAQFIEEITETFDVDRNVADYLARYFFSITRALADDEEACYIDIEDLGDLFALSIDFLIEYQSKNPEIEHHIRDITDAYTRLEEHEFDAVMGRIFELEKVDRGLPLSLAQIRNAFRLPIVHPIVRRKKPADFIKELQEKGHEDTPLWERKTANQTEFFFLQTSDLEAFIQKKKFRQVALPDGNRVLAILKDGETTTVDNELANWLQKQDKLSIEVASPLLSDFLISAVQAVDREPTVNLTGVLDQLRDLDEVSLNRKINIYTENLQKLTNDSFSEPVTFCDKEPQNVNIWGESQQRNVEAMVTVLSQGFRDLSREDRKLLGELASLFDEDHPLYFIASEERRGYPSIARDLLPRRTEPYEQRSAIRNAGNYFDKNQRDHLRALANILPEKDFARVGPEEDHRRLLRALWKAQRGEYQIENLSNNINWLEREVIPKLDTAASVEEAVNEMGADGVDHGEYGKLVTASKLGAFNDLQVISSEARESSDIVVQRIFDMFLNVTRDREHEINELSTRITAIQQELNEFQDAVQKIRNMVWDCERVRSFTDISEDQIEFVIEENRLKGTLDIENAAMRIREHKNTVESYSSKIKEVEEELESLESRINGIEEANPEITS